MFLIDGWVALIIIFWVFCVGVAVGYALDLVRRWRRERCYTTLPSI